MKKYCLKCNCDVKTKEAVIGYFRGSFCCKSCGTKMKITHDKKIFKFYWIVNFFAGLFLGYYGLKNISFFVMTILLLVMINIAIFYEGRIELVTGESWVKRIWDKIKDYSGGFSTSEIILSIAVVIMLFFKVHTSIQDSSRSPAGGVIIYDYIEPSVTGDPVSDMNRRR